jgi:hypothetical protein
MRLCIIGTPARCTARRSGPRFAGAAKRNGKRTTMDKLCVTDGHGVFTTKDYRDKYDLWTEP